MNNRRYCITVIALLFLLSFPVNTNAEPNTELNVLKENLNEVTNNISREEEVLQKLDDEISLNTIKSSDLETDLVNINLDISNEESELKKLERSLSDRLRSSYECFGSSLDYLEFFSNSKSLSDLFSRKKYLEYLVSSDQEMIENVNISKEKLEDYKSDLEQSKSEYDSVTRNLQLQITSSKELLNKLNQSKDNLSLQINVNEERVVNPLINLIDSTNTKSELIALRNSLTSINVEIMSPSVTDQINNALGRINLKIASLERGSVSIPIDVDSPIIKEAYKYLGIPYLWGGTDPNTGLDCSGLTQLCYHNLGYEITRTTYTQVKEGVDVPVDLNSLKPGDLIFFGDSNSPHHVALYIKDNYYIHAPHTGDVVKISYGATNACCARRIVK